MPLWFLAILVLIKSLLPDPVYNPDITVSADTPIGLDLSLKQLDGKSKRTTQLRINKCHFRN